MDSSAEARSLQASLAEEVATNKFVSVAALQTICSVEVIRGALDLRDSDPAADEIYNNCIRFFSILALADQLYHFNGLRDSDMFGEGAQDPYFNQTRLQAFLPDVSDDEADAIVGAQWNIPPVLSKVHHHRFPKESKLPLSVLERVGRGGYGDVLMVAIRKGQLEADNEATRAVLKIIRVPASQSKDNTMREVHAVRVLRHRRGLSDQAIITLWASFEQLVAGTRNDALDFHFIFPPAKFSLQDWLELSSTTVESPQLHAEDGRLYVCSQISSLFSALAFLHRPYDHTMVYHFDIKPGNILGFLDEGNPPAPPTWKIADFGLARVVNLHDRPYAPTFCIEAATPGYAPPECFDSRGRLSEIRRHGDEFDMYSMGCVAFELMWLACHGRRGRERFQGEFRVDPKRISITGHLDTARSWLDGMESSCAEFGQGSRGIAREIILQTRQCLQADPTNRPCAWEVESYLLKARLETDQPRKRMALLQGIVPRLAACDENARHRVLERVKARGWQELITTMRSHGWSDPGSALPAMYSRSLVSTEQYLTNLPSGYPRYRLYGRRDLVDGIHRAFKRSRNGKNGCVGLYGLGGMGKSHVAFDYVFEYRKNCDDGAFRPRHTFWINANNQSTFTQSCVEICELARVPQTDDPFSDMTAWLRDEDNGAWILVIDGVDDIEQAEMWARGLPPSRLGMILITTVNREILEEFTGLDDNTTFHVGSLDNDDARKIFDQELGPYAKHCSEEEFKRLAEKVKTPFFIKLSAQYLRRNKSGGMTAKILNDTLESNTGGHLGHMLERELGTTELFGSPFSTLLGSFLNECGPESMEFTYLGILSSFSPSHLTYDLAKSFCAELSEATFRERILAFFGNRGYISPGDDSGREYVTHPLIQAFFLQYIIERKDLGWVRALGYSEWMLRRIYFNYQRDRNRRETRARRLRQDSYSWKIQYMPHFEQFLQLIKWLREDPLGLESISDWEFRRWTAESILTFCRVLAADNRYSESTMLLEFVLNQGVCDESPGPGSDLGTAEATSVDIHLSLATQIEDSASGRRRDDRLREAKLWVDKGLALASKAGLAGKLWRLRINQVRILTKLGRFGEAQQQLEDLKATREVEQEKDRKYDLCVLEETAFLCFREALATRRRSRIIEAKRTLERLVLVIESMHGEHELLEDAKKQLAEVDSHIPLRKCLHEAATIYSDVLRRKKDRFTGRPEHPDVARAELNLAAVRLRQGAPQQARDSLEPLFDCLIERWGEEDGLTREIAYALRTALAQLQDVDAVAGLEARFVEKGLDPATETVRFLEDDESSAGTPWPPEWEDEKPPPRPPWLLVVALMCLPLFRLLGYL